MKDEGYIIKIHVKDAIAVSMPIKFSKKFHRGIYANKIHVKDTIAVPIPIKFNKKFHRGIYANKIQ